MKTKIEKLTEAAEAAKYLAGAIRDYQKEVMGGKSNVWFEKLMAVADSCETTANEALSAK